MFSVRVWRRFFYAEHCTECLDHDTGYGKGEFTFTGLSEDAAKAIQAMADDSVHYEYEVTPEA